VYISHRQHVPIEKYTERIISYEELNIIYHPTFLALAFII
jgi:hypothetical protein